MTARGIAALRRLAQPRAAGERCELCAVVVPERHQHLVDPSNRRLICACEACAILFDYGNATKYRRVPRDVRRLDGFVINDAVWNSLGIPIGLVFFFRSSVSNDVMAVYPSPGGPAEVAVEPDVWNELACGPLQDDVEALLVNRVKGARDYFVVPIDHCYRLIGLVRRHWQGFSGGDEMWTQMGLFFEDLKQYA